MKIKRECMKCGRMFVSQGTSNRLCDSCNKANLKLPKLDLRTTTVFEPQSDTSN